MGQSASYYDYEGQSASYYKGQGQRIKLTTARARSEICADKAKLIIQFRALQHTSNVPLLLHIVVFITLTLVDMDSRKVENRLLTPIRILRQHINNFATILVGSLRAGA